jgi:DNA-directed RNA polymerase specialized sigma24 family protein
MLVRLQHDWDHLRHVRSNLHRARQWDLPVQPGQVHPIDSLDQILRQAGYGQSDGTAAHNEFLAVLVRLSATDELAARVVLQRLLPGISSLARRRVADGRLYSELLDEVLASAWTVIRTYPVDRRHTFVAVGLLREIEYQAFRRAHRRLATFVSTPMQTLDTRPAAVSHPCAAEELRDLLEAALLAGLSADDVELARRLGRGETTRDIATATKVTDRTVRNRRDVVTYRLRTLAMAAV